MRWGLRGIVIAAALALSAAAPTTLALFAINLANSAQITVELEGKGNTSSYAHRAGVNKESRCRPLSEDARADCEAKEDEAARQAEHDERDLVAQRATAIWTRYMGAAAILGTAFGIFGIALVLATFWENKRSADAAHDANRPWLEGGTPYDIDMEFAAEGVTLSAYVDLINHGNSPATGVLIRAKLITVRVQDSGVGTMANIRMAKAKNIPASGIEAALNEWEKTHKDRGQIVYPNKPDRGVIHAKLSVAEIQRVEGEPPENCHFFLIVGTSYRYGAKKGRTVRAYLLIVKGHDRLAAAPYNVPNNMTHLVGSGHLELVDTLEGYAT